ncbi:MAG: Mur ligase family protein, partial [Candidatus Omnitrophota bacterium]|nr:Mur ligase family protein [Candidatus Omnitrophota bacterium]
MTYPEAIQYLESFINYERLPAYPYKEYLKLERVQGFLEAIGDPQDSLKCIHVAGSKGKGSTCAYITYILREAGFKTGLYTSPHLSDFRERIRILSHKVTRSQGHKSQKDFEGMITKRELAGLVRRFKPAIEKYNKNSPYGPLSFFEVYTALAFIYFQEQKVDFAVLETGLGGRLDATNVARALVAVITPISYEHTDKLGNTLRKIATEKAGIIKSVIGYPCLPLPAGQAGAGRGYSVIGREPSTENRAPIVISAPQEREAREAISDKCKRVGARLFEVGKDIKVTSDKSSFGFAQDRQVIS